LDQD
jgi:hypothetical protein